MRAIDDRTLPDDLHRVGRWFWLTFLLGGSVRIMDFPVLLPLLGVLLLLALHRLARGRVADASRPEMALPACAVVIVVLAPFVALLPGPDAVSTGASVLASLAALLGVGSYVTALADFVRRADLGDGRSIDHRARQWWATSAALVVVSTAVAVPLAADTFQVDDDWIWLLAVGVAMTAVLFHGLYRVGQAQREVRSLLAASRRQRRSDNPGFTATGRPT